ncbi:hypothetical protein ACFSJS_22685 [Streptomyces desertarenae]|uniref:Uncharacterized protein n=1 Tax=Streptomyces desertarenae TaxID=2666184 RepID=A0ABW4PQS1_9ACTN
MNTTAVPLRHGYTLTDLDHLARTVATSNLVWWAASDRDDLYTAAWHGIVEHLYTAHEKPTRTDLRNAGLTALEHDTRNTMRHRGAIHDGRTGQRYAAYWEWAGRATPGPEATVIDRHALHQIWPRLSPRHRQVLAALAATGDHTQAAAALGLAAGTYRSHLFAARRTFLALWHQGETPSRLWRADQRAARSGDGPRGSRRLTVSQVEAYRQRCLAGEPRAALAAEAGVHVKTLNALLRGRSKPAPDNPHRAEGVAA